MIVNVDGYISEIPDDAAFIEFRSGDECAGTIKVLDAEGNELGRKSLAAEFNLPQRPWWERLDEVAA